MGSRSKSTVNAYIRRVMPYFTHKKSNIVFDFPPPPRELVVPARRRRKRRRQHRRWSYP